MNSLDGMYGHFERNIKERERSPDKSRYWKGNNTGVVIYKPSIDTMETNVDLSNIDVTIEDDSIHSSFAKVLKSFRIEFGASELRSIALGFKVITYKKLMSLYDTDSLQVELISNWILECKFWTMLESLLDVKFNKDLSQSVQKTKVDLEGVCEYSSDTVLQDKIISSDGDLLQIFTCINTLSDTFKLDFPTQDDENNVDDENELQYTKWHNTLLKLNSTNRDPTLVRTLDVDSPLRTGYQVDFTDAKRDEAFFKRAYKLLLSHEFDDLKTLCEATNNWDFALMLAGLNDRIDPVIDLNDFSKNTVPSGVKSKLLRKRAIYQLANSTKLDSSPYEKACYGILSSDFMSANELATNWEEKLYLYLSNVFSHKLDTKIMKLYQDLGMDSEVSLISKLTKPPVVSNSVDDILNKLSNDRNPVIKEQSKHSIRVLIGSVISDNVKTLMENTVQSLDKLLSVDDNIDNEITNESYLLRILAHLAIILQLIYGEQIINNHDYTKLLKCYILRLILYKSYDLVPVYVSFIPTEEAIIEIYSSLLFQFEYSSSDRFSQISGMRTLRLPLEPILRKTIEKAFNETTEYYPTSSEIQLNYQVDGIDEKLYSTIYWFIDAGMIFDCLDAIIVLLRRFLLVGKIGSAIEFLGSISLPQLIDNYRCETSVLTNMKESNADLSQIQHIPNYKLLELTQYHNLFSAFKLMLSYDPATVSYDDLQTLIKSLDKIVKSWLFDLVDEDSSYHDNEILDSDVDIYKELRRIYIPTLFNALFDVLVENKSKGKKFAQQAVELVNLLADEEYKLYDILNSTDELKTFLVKFSNVGCLLYGDNKEGVYV